MKARRTFSASGGCALVGADAGNTEGWSAAGCRFSNEWLRATDGDIVNGARERATSMSSWKKESMTLPSGGKVMAQMPIIVSASRATDIPAFYADWFMERLRAGYVRWHNPFNGVPLYVSFGETRLIVFWSKNPKPLLPHLDELDRICPNYYFQYTLNDYDSERIESHVPRIDSRIDTLIELSSRIGRDRVVWRFDPLVLTGKLDVDMLLDRIERIGDRVAPFAARLVFSFIDIKAYKKVSANLEHGNVMAREFSSEEMLRTAEGIARLAKGWGIPAATCAECISLDSFGIEHNRCIDDRLIVRCFSHDAELMRAIGARYVPGDLFAVDEAKKFGHWSVSEDSRKDKGQRIACGCIMSKDIGEYNTCPHLCRYCYANASDGIVLANWKRHRECPHAETITGR